MSEGINKVILLGNVGQDPDLRYTPSGQAVCDLRLATTERRSGRDGAQAKEYTEWHTIVVWGKQGEIVKQYVQKGRQLYVEGRLKTSSWDDKDGKKRYKTEVVADKVLFIGGGGGTGGGRRSEGDDMPPRTDADMPPAGGGDDDIPF